MRVLKRVSKDCLWPAEPCLRARVGLEFMLGSSLLLFYLLLLIPCHAAAWNFKLSD